MDEKILCAWLGQVGCFMTSRMVVERCILIRELVSPTLFPSPRHCGLSVVFFTFVMLSDTTFWESVSSELWLLEKSCSFPFCSSISVMGVDGRYWTWVSFFFFFPCLHSWATMGSPDYPQHQFSIVNSSISLLKGIAWIEWINVNVLSSKTLYKVVVDAFHCVCLIHSTALLCLSDHRDGPPKHTGPLQLSILAFGVKRWHSGLTI